MDLFGYKRYINMVQQKAVRTTDEITNKAHKLLIEAHGSFYRVNTRKGKMYKFHLSNFPGLRLAILVWDEFQERKTKIASSLSYANNPWEESKNKNKKRDCKTTVAKPLAASSTGVGGRAKQRDGNGFVQHFWSSLTGCVSDTSSHFPLCLIFSTNRSRLYLVWFNMKKIVLLRAKNWNSDQPSVCFCCASAGIRFFIENHRYRTLRSLGLSETRINVVSEPR